MKGSITSQTRSDGSLVMNYHLDDVLKAQGHLSLMLDNQGKRTSIWQLRIKSGDRVEVSYSDTSQAAAETFQRYCASMQSIEVLWYS